MKMGNYWSEPKFPTPEEVQKKYQQRIITDDDIRKGLEFAFKKDACNSKHPTKVHVHSIEYCIRSVVKQRGVDDWALFLDNNGTCLDGSEDNKKEFIYNTIVQKFPDAIPGWKMDQESSPSCILFVPE